MSYGRVPKTKGPVRSQRPVHCGRITAHDFRSDPHKPVGLFKSESGRWVVANTSDEPGGVEGFRRVDP